jgi:hypothetical protein
MIGGHYSSVQSVVLAPDSSNDQLIAIYAIVYGAYLVFQLYSHTKLYEDSGGDVIKSTRYAPKKRNPKKPASRKHLKFISRIKKPKVDSDSSQAIVPATADTTRTNTSNSQTLNGHPEFTNVDVEAHAADDKEDEIEIPQMSLYMTLGLLGVVTVVSSQNPVAITIPPAHGTDIACGHYSRMAGRLN